MPCDISDDCATFFVLLLVLHSCGSRFSFPTTCVAVDVAVINTYYSLSLLLIMPVDASASLMHRRYRMYTTRLSQADTDLYPIEEESPRRKWPFYALVACSFAFVVLLTVSAAYSQESEVAHEGSTRYRLPFDKRNRYVFVCVFVMRITVSPVFVLFLFIIILIIILSFLCLDLQNKKRAREIAAMACIPSEHFNEPTNCPLRPFLIITRVKPSLKPPVSLWWTRMPMRYAIPPGPFPNLDDPSRPFRHKMCKLGIPIVNPK